MKRHLSAILLATLVVFLFAGLPPVKAEELTCAVYFTGIGCPHCAKADPFLLEEMVRENPDLVIIEYEIYQNQVNGPLILKYNDFYSSGLGIPLLIFNSDYLIVGDLPIIENFENAFQSSIGNHCPLSDGGSESFGEIDINSIPGEPKIWKGEKILIHSGGIVDSGILKDLLMKEPAEALEGVDYREIDPNPVPLSGKNVEFGNAVSVRGWILQWNGEPLVNGNNGSGVNGINQTNQTNQNAGNGNGESADELTMAKILSLASVDAVNPCAIAVLTLMLIAIITYNPKDRRNVLLAGLAFTLSVYILYMVYGLVIIRFFQIIQALTSIRLLLYVILGFVAMVLGALNIKDFFRYSPGGAFTEMPLFMRPRMKSIIEGIVSVKGAFAVGAFVTIFLLPCTIGPYVIAGGILSILEIMEVIPWLLIYNLIFVSPMIAITVVVYAGFTTVENVSGWKERNIRYLHLIAGTVMFLLGIAMVMGWV